MQCGGIKTVNLKFFEKMIHSKVFLLEVEGSYSYCIDWRLSKKKLDNHTFGLVRGFRGSRILRGGKGIISTNLEFISFGILITPKSTICYLNLERGATVRRPLLSRVVAGVQCPGWDQ